MDKLDRWTRLLGTVLVKVSFIDEKGEMVKQTQGGRVQLDVLHGGVYDIKYVDSPYYISELLIGFGQGFAGFNRGSGPIGQTARKGITGIGANAAGSGSANTSVHGQITEIYWSPDQHKVSLQSEDGSSTPVHEGENPYGRIPAVPFFNAEPAHYYFLPINEPLLYANHAINMRITDLNHIAKFQSFGIPVLSGVERGSSIRRGRPVDDFNFFRSGSASRSSNGALNRFGTGAQHRTFDNSFAAFADGNADANAVGMSIGPDTAISVGEKGDFKFASPNADIEGLARTIQQIQDWVRINHGLQPKGNAENPMQESGFSKMISKIGVLEDNIRRQKLFREREQQLFDTIKTLWNIHYGDDGSMQFDENATLEITYVEPQFPVDPLTKVNLIEGERKVIESGDRRAIRQMFKHLDEDQITDLIENYHNDRMNQLEREVKLVGKARELEKAMNISEEELPLNIDGLVPRAGGGDKSISRQDNRFKKAQDSGIQKKRNPTDTRPSPKKERAEKPQGK